jgi:hypothetical protein
MTKKKMNNEEEFLKENPDLEINLFPKEEDPNAIVFSYFDPPEEIIRINKEGFFWKSKLIVEDKEIYLRFKDWLDMANTPKPEIPNLNSIEERDNLIALLQESLKFYAKKENYSGNKNIISCCSGTSASYVEIDEGSQARFALEKAEQMIKLNQKMQNDYDNIISGYEQLQANEEIADSIKLQENLLNTFKTIGNDGNQV